MWYAVFCMVFTALFLDIVGEGMSHAVRAVLTIVQCDEEDVGHAC